MANHAQHEARRWLVSAGTALAAVALIMPLFRAPKLPESKTPAKAGGLPLVLRLPDATRLAADEKTRLTDPTPQFLPTKWNAAQRGLVGPEPGASFPGYPPKLHTGAAGSELKPNLQMPVSVPATALEALLMDPPGSGLRGFGQTTVKVPALASRGAFVEIVAEGTGQTVLRQALADAKPPGDGTWHPLEFSIRVDAAGLDGPLVVMRRSEVEGVDNYFQRYLTQTLRVGQRLAPGFYRITVGP